MHTFHKVWTYLMQEFVSDIHLWIAVGVACVGVAAHAVEAQISDGLLISALIIMVLSLVGEHLKNGYRESEQEKEYRHAADLLMGKLQSLSEMNAKVLRTTTDRKVFFRRRPSEAADYSELWGGFDEGEYFAFNPSYRLEKLTRMDKARIYRDVFVRRYSNPRFKKAYYVFLTKDEAGREDLKTFRSLMEEVKGVADDDLKRAMETKMCVMELPNREASKDAEIYIGKTLAGPTAVVEVKDQALGACRGKPEYYLLINDQGVISKYFEHVNKAIEEEGCVSVGMFSTDNCADDSKGVDPSTVGGA